MAWTKNGTVAATNGQVAVTGTGTSFIANKVQAGDAILLADGRFYEIAGVASDTALTLAVPYSGGTASGMGYAVLPTNNRVGELAGLAAELLNSFATVRDGVGQGMFPAGTVAAPGVRAANDQDTGIYWPSANSMSLVTGGVSRITVTPTGVGIGTVTPARPFDFRGGASDTGSATVYGRLGNMNKQRFVEVGHKVAGGTRPYFQAYYGDSDAETGATPYDLLLNPDGGNLLVGTTTNAGWSAAHRISKTGLSTGVVLLSVDSTAQACAEFQVTDSGGLGASVPSALRLSRNTTSGRSLTTEGTLNGGGADYAEYMLKAAGCGLIAKGDVCGVDAKGHLTKSWSDALSFVVKSTDPVLVGGDSWAKELRAKPKEPGAAPIEPITPTAPEPSGAEPVPLERAEGESDDDFAARVIAHASATALYQERVAQWAAFDAAMSAHSVLIAQYQSALADHQAVVVEYDADLAEWEDELEALRVRVDRIAFSGQVPCNVTGEFAVGDYIVAAANGGGIKAIAVPEADMTLPLYMKRIGKVWAVTDDGRAWIDVQHG